MSNIAAGTTTTTALVSTGDTSGDLQLQVNGTTPSITLKANGAVGVGSTPSYGTSGYVLTSNGSSTAPSWQEVPVGAQGYVLQSTGETTLLNASPNTGLGII